MNSIAPGAVETDIRVGSTDSDEEKLTASIPMKRQATTRDIASLILWLCSEDASYVTGTTKQSTVALTSPDNFTEPFGLWGCRETTPEPRLTISPLRKGHDYGYYLPNLRSNRRDYHLLVLVTVLKWPAYIALLAVAVVTALVSGVPSEVIPLIIDGMGSTLGSVAILVGLGAMLGGILENQAPPL